MVVKPVDTDDVITATAFLPIIFQKLVIGNSHLPLEVIRHQVNDTLILRILIIRLQTPEHNHLCPQFAFAVTFIDRTEIAIRLATGKYTFNPIFGFFNHLRVIQDVCQITVPFEPVRDFLPAVIATSCQPGIIILFQPSADFSQVSGQTVTLQLQILLHPSFGLNTTYRQLYKIQRSKRSAIPDIIGIDGLYVRSVYYRHRTTRRSRRTSCNRHSKHYRCKKSFRFIFLHFVYSTDSGNHPNFPMSPIEHQQITFEAKNG